jgi:hypothetical protein
MRSANETNRPESPPIQVWEPEGGLIEIEPPKEDDRHGRKVPEWDANPFKP